MVPFAQRATRFSLLVFALMVFTASHLRAADTLESLVAGAKKEEEIVFIAGAPDLRRPQRALGRYRSGVQQTLRHSR